MNMWTCIEEFNDYDSSIKLHEKYGDWTIIGLLDEIEKLEKKVKRLQNKNKKNKLQTGSSRGMPTIHGIQMNQ